MTQYYINTITQGDSEYLLKNLDDNSIDVVITDPPYFLDKLDNEWDNKKVANKANQNVIRSLPAGMKFDKEQGNKFYNWYFNISKELLRVLKPGGFFFSFSSPRLYHKMACSMDDAGFEIRDMMMWLYTQNQMKAMSLNHFINRLEISEADKIELKTKLNGWKTPQIKSCFEPIAMGQKPTEGTFLNNMTTHEVGLLNAHHHIGKQQNMSPANVFTVEKINEIIDKAFLISKPKKEEKGEFNHHKTVKPIEICTYLINLSLFSENGIVLDPFAGSGTTCVAAEILNKNYIGFELNNEYVEIAEQRIINLKEKLNEVTLFS